MQAEHHPATADVTSRRSPPPPAPPSPVPNPQDSDNWNQLFQDALDMPEEDDDQCYEKWQRLTTVNRDFVAAAVTYGRTIISEYFLEDVHKSIK